MLIAPGDQIPLNAQLADFVTTKFIRAYLYEEGTPYATPTADLSHVENGFYFSNALVMPNKRLFAVYRAYDDAGFTTPSGIYLGGVDVFNPSNALEVSSGSCAKDLLGQIAVNEITGTVESPEVFADIEDQGLESNIDSAEGSAEIDTPTATATVDEPGVDGEAGC